jgi:hypothetical protein
VTHREFIVIRDRIMAVLECEQRKRPGRTIDHWILEEREVMFRAVNVERMWLGKGPMSYDAVLRVENSAKGHTDYTRKYAQACAFLVRDEP